MVVTIEKAEYLDDYKIKFNFSDGVTQTIDFGKFLQSARNPMTRKYLNVDEFKKFTIEFGDIIWNDYELCFPIWDLHEGKV